MHTPHVYLPRLGIVRAVSALVVALALIFAALAPAGAQTPAALVSAGWLRA
ncbi:MAG: hypothetical protein HY056_08435, partial [Proteobacteria bacterium]|nr:hypothetical protein [Pseudomonadota bacterium]